MNKTGKLGTFSGVFTPSILTILGVIMYLRLPTIIGQAGLFETIAIVLVAHVISITTGLSVASIATDKRVKAGGTYYMISRSLGLPIGGTLGLALFVGLSFSVSLYVIGFSESFLGFIGIDTTKNMIRIAGTVTLALVTLITFISTNLAIKTQFFILFAIVLSLISILLGGNINVPAEPLLRPAPTAAPFIVLFGIFFPAVTGFEAGVSMSGDLKDPKKSIPFGTIAAIAVGLLTYIGLATFFAYRVAPDELVNNSKILLDISLFPPLVIAGIWGATISSALGSILGAPRILQATSVDRITFKFFAAGYGKENEPRHALLMTFLIAEGGILIGELDVIARVVSMFFITTYGFLNFSCAAESWASPDFRPEFRIPRFVSILGSITCFVVMIQLDFLAMIGATLILGMIFFYLERKELALESGDTWEGIWSSLVRIGLHRLNQTITHQRNWRPNAILFSGGTEVRPHLLKFGKWLVDKRGMLSNFDLIEKSTPDIIFRKAEQSLTEEEDEVTGVFTRRMECNDIYECMMSIVKIYGFSGIEPNTVLLGWARNTRNPQKFVNLAHVITQLDYNLLLLNYDKKRGFGQRETIDIWWRGTGNNLALALAVIRFLTSSYEWRQAKIRLLILNEDSSLTELIQTNVAKVLEDYRMEAGIKIINNAIEHKPFYDIIKLESVDADLTITGIPHIDPKEAESYVLRTNSIVDELGTVLLIKASSYFREIYVGIKPKLPELAAKTLQIDKNIASLPTLDLPAKLPLADAISRFNHALETINTQWYENYLTELQRINLGLIKSVGELAERNFSFLDKNLMDESSPRNHKTAVRAQNDFLFHIDKAVSEFIAERLPLQKEILADSATWLFSKSDSLISTCPMILQLTLNKSELAIDQKDSFSLKYLKLRKRIFSKFFQHPLAIRIKFREVVGHYKDNDYYRLIFSLLQEYAIESHQTVADLQKLLDSISDKLRLIENRLIDDSAAPADLLAQEREEVQQLVETMIKWHRQQRLDCRQSLLRETRKMVQNLSDGVSCLDTNELHRKARKQPKESHLFRDRIGAYSEHWHRNQCLFFNVAKLGTMLMMFRHRLRIITGRLFNEIQLSITTSILEKLNSIRHQLAKILEGEEESSTPLNVSSGSKLTFNTREFIENLHSEMRMALNSLPETIETLSNQAIRNIEQHQFDDVEVLVISLRRLVDYIIETEFIGPLQTEINKLPAGFQKANGLIQDVIQLTMLNQTNPGKTAEFDYELEEDPASLLKKGLEGLKGEHDTIETQATMFIERVEALQVHAFEKLNPYGVTRIAGAYQHYIQAQRGREMRSWMAIPKRQIQKYLGNGMTKVMYRLSEDILSAKKRHSVSMYHHESVDHLLSLVESCSPLAETQKLLPFYYNQLFLGKPMITKELWIGRNLQIHQSEEALERFRRGHIGGLLIAGEQNSGKTALSHYIANKFFERSKVYYLTPSEGGSIDFEEFKQRLEEAVNFQGEFEDMFNHLPYNSAIVINDLELWWERSDPGLEVINLIMNLINRFGDRCLFLLNVNSHTLRFINQIQKIDDNFLKIVECTPFSTVELKDIISIRHQSTGLKFQLEGQREDKLSKWKQAKLFTSYFEYSEGNVGVALQAWISHIQEVNDEALTLKVPENDTLQFCEHLKSIQVILIIQFLLHKRLTIRRLERLMKMSETALLKEINTFKRSGILVEKRQDVLEVNPFIQPMVSREFVYRGFF